MQAKMSAVLLVVALNLTACGATPPERSTAPPANSYRSTQPVVISEALQRVLDRERPMRYSIKKHCECECP